MSDSREELEKILNRIFARAPKIPSDELTTFSKLIKLTLEFRDHWERQYNQILTVGQTREAIDYYAKAINNESLPQIDDKMVRELVKLWLAEINGWTGSD